MSTQERLIKLFSKYGIDPNREYKLGLFRSLLREGRKMPTLGRRMFVKTKTIQGFREFQFEEDPVKIFERLRVADYQVDTVRIQAQNLLNFMEHDAETPSPPTEDALKRQEQEKKDAYKQEQEKSWK